jgi:sigma-B regulation protein RsbQ
MDPLTRNNVTVTGNQAAARTMLFVNGLGTDQSYWNQVTPAFADAYRIVLFDNVGAVESNQACFRAKPSRYLNVKGYATDLLEICSALKLRNGVILVGHSLGATAGLLASIERPRQFGRLVLLGASPRYADSDTYHGGFSKKDIDATYAALQQDYVEWSKALASAAIGTANRPALALRFAESIARIPQDMMLTVLCSILQTDHRAGLVKVSVPTLVIQSQQDYFVPLAVARYLQTNIPDCQLTLIEATGHLPHVSAPGKVVAAIEKFIRDTDGSIE